MLLSSFQNLECKLIRVSTILELNLVQGLFFLLCQTGRVTLWALPKSSFHYFRMRRCLTEQRHFNALLESQTVVVRSFNAQPEAPAERADAGASGWALNDAPEVTYACCHRRHVALSN